MMGSRLLRVGHPQTLREQRMRRRRVSLHCDDSLVADSNAELPSQRGETWNDAEAIARHRRMTPSQRVALAIEVSQAALRIAHAERVPDDEADTRA
jgi:hypothetical protein